MVFEEMANDQQIKLEEWTTSNLLHSRNWLLKLPRTEEGQRCFSEPTLILSVPFKTAFMLCTQMSHVSKAFQTFQKLQAWKNTRYSPKVLDTSELLSRKVLLINNLSLATLNLYF